MYMLLNYKYVLRCAACTPFSLNCGTIKRMHLPSVHHFPRSPKHTPTRSLLPRDPADALVSPACLT